MIKSAVRRRRFEELSPLLLPPLPSTNAVESPPSDAAPFLSSTNPNASITNEQENTISTTMAPSMMINTNDARLAAPDGMDMTTTTSPEPADETTNWEEEETATAYFDEKNLPEEEEAAAAAAASETPAIADPAAEEQDDGDSLAQVTPVPVATATYVPNNEKITPPPIYSKDPMDVSAATLHPQPQQQHQPDAAARPEQPLKTTAMGVVVALIFVFYLVRWCCRRRGDGWDTSRGQYRAVANQYASNQYDDAFADDLSDCDDEYDDEVLDDGGGDDDFSYNGNGKMIELKDMKRDRGRLSLQEMNG